MEDIRYTNGHAGSGHGPVKVFQVFVRNGKPGEKFALGRRPQPVGTIVVKEAWTPEVLDDEARGKQPAPGEVRGKMHDITYRGGTKYGIFIMAKMDPATPNTDAGWVYGVISSNQTILTPAGAVGACAKCHKNAPHDRLFGPTE